MAVYLIVHQFGPVKIGCSNNPIKRVKKLDVGPFPLRLIGVVKAHDDYAVEEYLNDRFSEKRIRGEWFDLDRDDVEYIFSEFNAHDSVRDPRVLRRNQHRGFGAGMRRDRPHCRGVI